MQFKSSIALLAMALLTACSSSPDSSAAGASTGTTGGGTTSTGSTSALAPINATAAAAQPGSEADLQQNVGDRIYFTTDQSQLTPEGQKTLERQAVWLRRFQAVTVTIEGHCDERGTREYNLALGERRAHTVRKALAALGVAESRITTITYGKERPAAVGSDEAAWAQNRRAVTAVN
jgi:peptidoglycan-associated lipoprotein